MYHFLNCLALAFAPHVLCYKATKLAEENGLRACFFAALGYAATQMVKIFVMASVLPSSGDDHSQVGSSPSTPREFHLFEELAKSVISLIEILGVQQTLALTPNLSKFSAGTRILAIGLGMAFAESLSRCLIPIVMGARGSEFSWTYLELAIGSNISLLLHLAFVTFVWLRMRTDVNKATLPLIWSALIAYCALPSLDNYLTLGPLHIDSWTLMGFHAVAALVACVIAKGLLSSYTAQRAASAVGQKKGQ